MRYVLLLLLFLSPLRTGLAADVATAMATLSPTVTLTNNHLCYSDGRDMACGDAAVTLSAGGTLTANTKISATHASFTTLTVNGSPVTGGGGGASLPTGTVMAFDLASCPAGWTTYTAAAGRVVFGVGTLGSSTYTLNGTGGSSAVTLASGNMPAHTHSFDPPSTATDTGSGHTHSFDPPAATIPSETHSHVMWFTSTYTSDNYVHGHTITPKVSTGTSTGPTAVTGTGGAAGSNRTSSHSSHSHTLDIPSSTSSSSGSHTHNFDVTQFDSDPEGVSHGHDVDVAQTTSGGGGGSWEPVDIRAPYISLLYCSKD